MTLSPQVHLDRCQRARLDLWRAASIELSIGPEATSPLVQAAIEAVLAWLRPDATSPAGLLQLYGQPHGALAQQLQFARSLLEPVAPAGRQPATEHPRLCWWVVKTAYHRRWVELARSNFETTARTLPESGSGR